MTEEVKVWADRQRQWIIIALLGEEITAKDAADRLSRLEKAERNGEKLDVRSTL